MAKSVRKIIKIDEDLCNGCGQCVPSCAEGAIQIIDGKARLVADKFCDGLGACLGECPQGALSFEERAAEEFDEDAAMDHVKKTRPQAEAHTAQPKPKHAHGGCPGSRMFDFSDVEDDDTSDDSPKLKSQLRQWPVKINLLNPSAPYLQGADLVLAADCTAFAYASFHPDFMKGKVIAIGCPKFDDIDSYIEKLTSIIETANLKSITVVHMEVPCCMGMLYAAEKAVEASGNNVPLESVVISIRGEVKSSPMFAIK
ncbi:MAG: ATP-binding protein [Armatimonadota bacterium]